MPSSYSISSLGDQAITIQLGSAIDESTSQNCLALAQHIYNSAVRGIKDIIPAYNTVSVIYDALEVHKASHTTNPSAFLQQQLQQVIETCNWQHGSTGRAITIQACFHESVAPDLYSMAHAKQLSVAQFVQHFIAKPYRVYMLGFLPGFAYMGKVDDKLAMPRKEKPHLNIPGGSIGIAGNQTGIYPLNCPGGWNIIGRTPLKMFDLTASQPCFLKAGDIVTFQQVSIEAFHHLNQNL